MITNWILHSQCPHLVLQLVKILEHELVSEVGSVSKPSLFIFLSRLFLNPLLNPDQSTLALCSILVGTGFFLLPVILEVVNILSLLSYLPTEVFAHIMHIQTFPPRLASQIPSLASVAQRLVRLANAHKLIQRLAVTCLQPQQILCRLRFDFNN